MSIKGQGHIFSIYFPGFFYILCFTWPRYQVSIYRTIGPLVSISNGFVSSKIHDKRDDFDFDIVNFPFWMAMFHVVPLMECIFLNS